YGMYRKMSDAEIEAFLALSDQSPEGAVYFAYLQMASDAAMESRTVKDFDLSIDLTKRATDLRLMAIQWKEAWDQVSADIFEVFDIGSTCRRCELSEGASCGCRF